MKIGPKLVTMIERIKFFAQGFSRAGVYYYINNGQIWADAVAGRFAVSLKALGEKIYSFNYCDQFRSHFHNFKRFPLGIFFLNQGGFKIGVNDNWLFKMKSTEAVRKIKKASNLRTKFFHADTMIEHLK